ncbi:hypothetical protein D3C81_1762400 [compost metagenome]
MVIDRLYARDRRTGAGNRNTAAMVYDSPDVSVCDGVIFGRYLLVRCITGIRNLADREGCSGLRDRIIDPFDDEYDSRPVSSRTPGCRHGAHGTGHHGRPCHRPGFVGLDH